MKKLTLKAQKSLDYLESKGHIKIQLILKDRLAVEIINAYSESASHTLPDFIRHILDERFSRSELAAGSQSPNGLAVGTGQGPAVSSKNDE